MMFFTKQNYHIGENLVLLTFFAGVTLDNITYRW